jgi:hypothetical protein
MVENTGKKKAVFDPKTAIYTPLEVSTYAIQTVKGLREGQKIGLYLGIPGVGVPPDPYFAPLMPGQVLSVIGQTSHYKSGFLHCVERHIAKQLVEDGREDEVIVHISTEEGIEEQAYVELARESQISVGKIARGEIMDWAKLEKAAIRIGSIPIYRIGDSLARADDIPHLYLSNMLRALDYLSCELMGRPLKIALLVFDYLQAFPIDPEVRAAAYDAQRRLQVREDFYRIRQAAKRYDCPAIVAVQAKQNLEGTEGPNMLLPGQYDGEETAAVAQRSDRIITLWLPKQTHQLGQQLDHKGMDFWVDEDLLWLKVAKQRGSLKAGKRFKMRIDYNNNEIKPFEFVPDKVVAE